LFPVRRQGKKITAPAMPPDGVGNVGLDGQHDDVAGPLEKATPELRGDEVGILAPVPPGQLFGNSRCLDLLSQDGGAGTRLVSEFDREGPLVSLLKEVLEGVGHWPPLCRQAE
jgi:hypothetical protein